jgi:hypothetical protein
MSKKWPTSSTKPYNESKSWSTCFVKRDCDSRASCLGASPFAAQHQSCSRPDLPDGTRTNIKPVKHNGGVRDHESNDGKRLTHQGRLDGRSRFDPEKYLKISVVRTLEWAKRSGKSAEAAHGRVMETIQERAEHYGFSAVPESVRSYIDLAVLEY